MKRYFGWLGLLALVAIPVIGCGPGEATIPEDAAAYDESEAMTEDNSTATMSLEDPEAGGGE